MDSLSKLDVIAGGAIPGMFLGVYAPTVSRSGLVIIFGGVMVIPVLFTRTVRTNR